MKTLQKLVASDPETLQMMSGKPYEPKFMDLLLLQCAPHFYTEEQKAQINHFKQNSSVESRSETKNTAEKRKIEEISEEESDTSMNKKPRQEINYSSPDLPTKFKNRFPELNNDDFKFLLSKKLYSSDVDPNKNRLSMPENEIACDFLTEAEVTKLCERTESNNFVGVEVTVLDPCLREFTILLKRWKMRSTYTYNLSARWKHIVSANKFEQDQELEIWTCRANNKLYFLLENV
uniref:B3 domain-containing protein At5g24050 family n=1 Tax=Cajanus cajan TaxID=3821 RepID=A0A151TI01_CAJCA|nr:B3 domain-containing protein At5g24050 family [Cajanus cajan]